MGMKKIMLFFIVGIILFVILFSYILHKETLINKKNIIDDLTYDINISNLKEGDKMICDEEKNTCWIGEKQNEN